MSTMLALHLAARTMRIAGCAAAAALTMTSCRADLDPDPTPTAASTEITFGPNDVAVGTLLDRAADAWTTVEGWSAEARVEQLDASESGGGSTVITEQVLLPATRRVLNTTEETIVSEEISIDGQIYMRGTLVPASIYPEVDADTWITFSPEDVPADTPLAQRVRYLTAAPEFPLATVTEETRALPASPVGELEISDRNCSVYQFVTHDDSSSGITYRLAFDSAWLPCRLIRESGGVVETTNWSFDTGQISINAPAGAVPVEEFPSAP